MNSKQAKAWPLDKSSPLEFSYFDTLELDGASLGQLDSIATNIYSSPVQNNKPGQSSISKGFGVEAGLLAESLCLWGKGAERETISRTS